jgi:hypothetical protein
MTDTSQQSWEDRAWERVKELEAENSWLRARLTAATGDVTIWVEQFAGQEPT